MDLQCPFCDRGVIQTRGLGSHGSIHLVYPSKPVIPQHVLLIPSRHVASLDLLIADEAVDVVAGYSVLKKAFRDLDGYTGGNMFVNDGPEAGQHVPHVHFHVFGRSVHEPENPYEVLKSIGEYPTELDPKEMQMRVERLRKALAQYL